jgi:ATPase subunit of ABC transporter with duplicated ATPase domains
VSIRIERDRAFLAETVDEIVELDPRSGRATAHAGGWDAYEREREDARRRARAEYDHTTSVCALR